MTFEEKFKIIQELVKTRIKKTNHDGLSGKILMLSNGVKYYNIYNDIDVSDIIDFAKNWDINIEIIKDSVSITSKLINRSTRCRIDKEKMFLSKLFNVYFECEKFENIVLHYDKYGEYGQKNIISNSSANDFSRVKELVDIVNSQVSNYKFIIKENKNSLTLYINTK